MTFKHPITTLIFDLGDVLFEWSASTTTTISPKTLRSILASDTWADLDCGRITQDECYRKAAEQHCLSASELHDAFAQARESLKPNMDIVSAIKTLKRACGGAVTIAAMSNMSREDYTILASRISGWTIFDDIFISGHVGTRKPDPAFFKHVLHEMEKKPEEVMFVDDKAGNVEAANELGIHGIVFDTNETVIRALRSVLEDPSQRGWRYLTQNIDHLTSITSNGISVDDNFAKLLIQDTVPLKNLIEAHWDRNQTWNFFNGQPVLVPGNVFPDDLDTTSLALMVLPPNEDVSTSVLDKMLEYVQVNGIFQTYFDPHKIRTDEVVSANVLACFYRFGRGHELNQTLSMVQRVLLNRTYLSGTRYYPYPDCCLYFFGRLLCSSNDADLHAKLGSLLKERVQERVGCAGSAIELAMRVITCRSLSIDCDSDIEALLEWQQDDGGWPASWMYQYGSTKVQLGNRGVTTAMAVKAISSA